MVNTSATGGYLAPREVVAAPDFALDALLQGIVVGIVGLDGTLVRPRWQPVDPKQPAQNVDWCAIGVTGTASDANAAIVHVPGTGVDDPAAYDQLQRHEVLTILASFYGPTSLSNASILRDGFQIGQNREAMFLNGIGFVDTADIVNAAELVNQVFVRRRDLSFRIRRVVVRTYPVLNLREAAGTVTAQNGGSSSFDTDTQ